MKARDTRSDETLVEATRRGNTQAFGELFERHAKTIHNLAYRMLQDGDEAREVTQNVFLKAYNGLDGFDGSHRFYSWIYRIAINESLNVIDERKRTTRLDEGLSLGSDVDTVERDETRTRVRRAVMRLTPHQRAVIALRHYLGQDYREMSRILDVPEKTVKSRLFSARQTLRELLAEAGERRARWSRDTKN